MRRGINIRKKKKIILKEINKKALLTLSALIILLILCALFYLFSINNILISKNIGEDNNNFSTLNENVPFSLNKIILFSSATATSHTVNQLLSLDISQYSDIGIYLNPIEDNSNTLISSLYINNILITSPEIGTTYLYNKKISDLGKCSFDEKNIINKQFNFNIINPENTINYDNYEVYCNGTTPITIGFYNQNIKTDFIIDKDEVLYNGTLLKEAIIPLTSLNCTVSFTINIITTTNQHYICNISFDIPFEDESGSIYDTGYITKEIEGIKTNKFIRIK